jgi:hypothetical protein
MCWSGQARLPFARAIIREPGQGPRLNGWYAALAAAEGVGQVLDIGKIDR